MGSGAAGLSTDFFSPALSPAGGGATAALDLRLNAEAFRISNREFPATPFVIPQLGVERPEPE